MSDFEAKCTKFAGVAFTAKSPDPLYARGVHSIETCMDMDAASLPQPTIWKKLRGRRKSCIIFNESWGLSHPWLYTETVAVGFYVENARPANQSAIVTVRNGRPADQNDP